MKSLNLSIASIALRLDCTDETFLQELVQERYAAFVAPDEQTDIRIVLRPSPSAPTRVRMESVSVRQAEGGWRFVYDTFVADVSAGADSAEVTCLRSAYAVDSFLRTLLALYLPQHEGLILHASAVSHGGKGYVFAGRSGAGKSTVARLLADRAEVLSDELVAIRHMPSGWWTFGTPFWGEFTRAGVNLSAPLQAIYLLRHATQHRLEPLPRRDTLTAILQCSLQFAEGAQVAEWMLNVVSALAREVPTYRLHFLPDPGFWNLLVPPERRA
ncbi:MAG: hypothetical protein KatS3mg023_0882 [Armatimonadota bacterium]|nr:MAG: hypothetical protein KatS3mg023_0882 [Armatimonadota bacterium]